MTKGWTKLCFKMEKAQVKQAVGLYSQRTFRKDRSPIEEEFGPDHLKNAIRAQHLTTEECFAPHPEPLASHFQVGQGRASKIHPLETRGFSLAREPASDTK